ncbi:MAG TPA: hypothetical protein DCX79_04050, partial [Planctomycetaceae bacterium]|nr:hypothetical protein [Planctomycetaceae bacterium]
ANGFGRDKITSLSSSNRFDLSAVTEDLTGSISPNQFVLSPSGYNRRFLGVATVNGRDAQLLPRSVDRVTVVQENHGLTVGRKVQILSPSAPAYTGEFTVESISARTFTIAAYNFDRPIPTGTASESGPIFHDGRQTAYIRTTISNWKPNHVLNLESSTNAYNGPVIVDRIDSNWYSFSVDWEDVREAVDTAVLPDELKLGSGDDHLTIPGSLNRRLSLFSSSGYDTLQIAGSLGEIQTIITGQYDNHLLHILWTGIDRLELVDPTIDMVIHGAADDAPIQFGNVSLGIVAQSLALPVDLSVDDFEVNVRDSLNLQHQLVVNELNLRVFGDDQSLTVVNPVSATTAQLTAPDGTVSVSGSLQFSGKSLAIKARELITDSGTLNLSADQLSLVVSSVSTDDLIIINDRDLLLTSEMDDTHLVPLDSGIAAVFQGITWVADIADDWADQVFDGRLNPYAVAAYGLLSITLPPQSDAGDEDTLTVRGGLRSWAGDIAITADEIDFFGGAGSVRAPGALTLKAATDVWTYRLGTSAETGGGGTVDPQLAPEMLDLPTRDLAALSDGFTQITIGRADAGNAMRLGDAFSMTAVKATGEARIIDASIKDPISLLTDTLIVEGDFRAPLDPLVVTANSAEIRKVNLHTPNNSNPDSGLSASRLTLNLQTSLQVGGWLSGTDALEITVPAASTIFGIITDVGSSIRQTGATGSLTVTTNRGIRVAGQISTAAAEAAPELTAGTRLDLLAGADVAATGANAVLELSAAEALTLHSGSLVRAGMTVDISSGAPVTSVTGVNGQISITTPSEMWLAGLVVSSGGLSLQSGTSDTDYTDLFNDLTDNSASHYLADQASFGLLLTGTILVQGADQELTLSSAGDVILLGNVTMSGDGADLTVQSDTFVYAEGRLTAADRLRVLGGVALDGTVLGSADRHGSSIYLAATGAVNTTQAGAEINLHGAQDVDIHLPLIAGGTVGATGITWAGDGSEVTVTAGQQIYLDAPIQAAAAIHLHPGTPGADDAGRNFIMSTASGL